MYGAIPEINYLFGMAECETRVARAAFVPGIRGVRQGQRRQALASSRTSGWRQENTRRDRDRKEREPCLQSSSPRRGGPNGAHSNTSDSPEFTRPSNIG